MSTHRLLSLAFLTVNMAALGALVGCGEDDTDQSPASGGQEGTGAGGNAEGGSAGSLGGGNGGSSGEGSGGEGGAPSVSERGPGGFDPDFETSDDFVTQMSELGPGLASSPHQEVQIFYSSNMRSLLGIEEYAALPEGTVAIKVQDRDGGGVDQIMVMVKKAPGTDANVGDWVWEQYDLQSYELVSSSQTSESFKTFCSDCHRTFAKTDWLGGTALSN